MRAPIAAVLAVAAAGCAGAAPDPVARRPASPDPAPVVLLPSFYREPPADEAPAPPPASPALDDLLPPIPDPAAAAVPEPAPAAVAPPPTTTPPDRVVIVFTQLDEPESLPEVAQPALWVEEDFGAELVEIVDVVYEDAPPCDVDSGEGPVLVVDGYSSWACGRFPVVLGCSRQDPFAVPAGPACVTDEHYDPCWDPRFDPRCGSWEKYWVDRRILQDGRKGDPRREREERREPPADPEPEGPRPGPENFPMVRDIPGRSPEPPLDRDLRGDPGEFGERMWRADPPAPFGRAEPAAPEDPALDRGPRPSPNGTFVFVQEDQEPPEPPRFEPPTRARELPRRIDPVAAERTPDPEPQRRHARPEADDRPAFRERPERVEERPHPQPRGRDRDEDDSPPARPEPRHEPRHEPREEPRREEPKVEPRRDRDDDDGGRQRGGGGGGGGHGKRDRDDEDARPRKK